MVKTLADSGLVEYEPYAGVALTEAGQKLAALVTRRHRLIELFLVQVMGYSWDEVHDEAEQLEHTVSDRLVDRMDAMLGRPETDPHGDPIPERRRAGEAAKGADPAHVSAGHDGHRDARDRSGQGLSPLHRTPQPETGRGDRGRGTRSGGRQRARARQQRRRLTIGTRAASKVLVQAVHVLLLVLLRASGLRPSHPRSRRTAAHGAFRLHGLSLQQPRVQRRSTRLPPLRPARDAHLLGSHPLRRRARARTRGRRGAGREGRARTGAGVRGLPAVPVVQRARRDDADADWHHQRAARAAGLLRCRTSVQ